MIRLDNISKQNGHQILFIEASAALNRGEKIGLVGPNGAGKTTTLRSVAGIIPPNGGAIRIAGIDLLARGGGGVRLGKGIETEFHGMCARKARPGYVGGNTPSR